MGGADPSPSPERFHAFSPTPELSILRDEMARTVASFPTLSSQRVALKLEETLLVILETEGPAAFDVLRRAGADQPAERVRRMVEAHWKNGLNVNELAFLCHMSVSTFKRRFKEAYGASPGQWLTERRLAFAAHLLRVENRRPTDVFDAAGFSSPSSFAQAFKARFGIPPRE